MEGLPQPVTLLKTQNASLHHTLISLKMMESGATLLCFYHYLHDGMEQYHFFRTLKNIQNFQYTGSVLEEADMTFN